MLSIITPVYNGIQFIEACIQVVINQNCPTVEHIIIDGGSTDQTTEVIKSYAAQYPHIRWVSAPDQGQSDAMNKGIAIAKGKIIGILNIDDYYEPHVLNQVLELFQTLPEPSLLVGNCQVWNDQEQLLLINRPHKLKLTDLLLGLEINPHPMNPSAYFYHASLHEKLGLYRVDEHYAMDLDFLLKAVQVAHVKYLDQTLGNYRFIQGTKTFNDIQAGTHSDRAKQLLDSYRKKLPLLQRLKVEVNYQWFYLKNGQRLKYFSQRPHQLIPHLKRKISQVLN
jgi:glycosyltransferase involved in cell wall biosynthesis